MKTIDFMKLLQSKLGGDIDYKDMVRFRETIKGIPRLVLNFQGEQVRFEIQNNTELYINIYKVPPHLLKIYHESFVTKLLDKVHLHSEVKIGDQEFDDKYIIEFTTPEIAQMTINPEFRECINNLEPFKVFQMKKRDYTLLKDLDKEYDVNNAENDIKNMVKIVKICTKIWEN
jgi:hypothetical protein